MNAVIKIGGNLAPDIVSRLCQTFRELPPKHKLALVAGGGRITQIVKDFQSSFAISDEVTHRASLLALDQNGLILADYCRVPCVSSIGSLKKCLESGIFVFFLPARLFSVLNPFDDLRTFHLSSDAVAAELASILRFCLIKATDVDGVFTTDPNEKSDSDLLDQVTVNWLTNHRTCLDTVTPRIIQRARISAWVVNGRHPQRVVDVLSNRPTRCSTILFSP